MGGLSAPKQGIVLYSLFMEPFHGSTCIAIVRKQLMNIEDNLVHYEEQYCDYRAVKNFRLTFDDASQKCADIMPWYRYVW